KPFPEKKEGKLKRDAAPKISDKKVEGGEDNEEEKITDGGEIMELANPEDEDESAGEEEAGESYGE
ncbi:MAG: hypothetical protein NTZ83_05395, partial [Candidatus Pacearchaeota archaeon]|nr:hypothetical protein [Candidatus Pacearchaeota archaeon]